MSDPINNQASKINNENYKTDGLSSKECPPIATKVKLGDSFSEAKSEPLPDALAQLKKEVSLDEKAPVVAPALKP